MQIKEIIREENQLTAKNIYIMIRQWMKRVGEDFIDENYHIVFPNKMIEWFYDSKMINKKVYDRCKYMELGDFAEGKLFHEAIRVYSNCTIEISETIGFWQKSYQMLAEYIASDLQLRNNFIKDFCIPEDEDLEDSDFMNIFIDGTLTTRCSIIQEQKDIAKMDIHDFLSHRHQYGRQWNTLDYGFEYDLISDISFDYFIEVWLHESIHNIIKTIDENIKKSWVETNERIENK